MRDSAAVMTRSGKSSPAESDATLDGFVKSLDRAGWESKQNPCQA
jgi:hypothetical protein